jgi:hypothetical protein
MQATRGEILPVVSHHAEKLVIGLKNAPLDFPDDDADDVGVDQRRIFLSRARRSPWSATFSRSLYAAGSLEPRERQRHHCQDCDNDDCRRDQPCLAVFECLGAPLLIHEQEALVVHYLVDLRSYLVQTADHRQRCRPGAGLGSLTISSISRSFAATVNAR